MKISLMTDLEGVAGVVNFDMWTRPGCMYYEQAKVLLTEEVNATIRGFYAAAGDEIERILVIDGHGPGGINPELLDPRAEYSRGWGVVHQFNLHEGFDVFANIGQHAKAGTLRSHLTHTGSTNVIDIRINGISVGEYGESVMKSGFYGTPAIFAAGERAFCEEAKALTPWVHTAETKYGVTEDNGLYLSAEEYRAHNTGAVHVHPNVARRRLYEGAKAALEDWMANPEKFKLLCPEAPFVRECWFRAENGAPGYKIVQRHESDIVKMYSMPVERYPEGTYELPYEYEEVK